MADLDIFLQDLSSGEPVPGGGSVAALQAALGASLLVMVANLTLGRKKYAGVQETVLDLRERASRLRDVASGLIQADIDAYGQVAKAMGLPRETDEQKAQRRERLQDALKAAIEPPLETMRVASRIVDLAVDLAKVGNRSAISDVGTAVLAARAAYHAALLNVEINLAAVQDIEWAARTRSELQRIPNPDEAETRTVGRVLADIRGEEA